MLKETIGYSLSLQQRRIWQQLVQGHQLKAQVALKISGCLDVDRLRNALAAAAQRHEALRTRFESQAGSRLPLQVVIGQSRVLWNEVDAINLPSAELDVLIRGISDSEANAASKNLESPVRSVCVSTASETVILLITVSPLCADFKSLSTLIEDLINAYGSAAGFAHTEPVQYAQFSEWQNDVLSSEEAAQAPVRQQLQKPSAAKLSFEKEGSGKFIPAAICLTLSRELAASVKWFAESNGTDMASVWLAAWEALLWRHLRQPQIVVAKSFDCREVEELRDGVGPYAKYLPLGGEPGLAPSFLSLTSQISEQLRRMLDWQQYAPVPQDSDSDFPFLFDCFDLKEDTKATGTTFTVLAQSACTELCNLKLEIQQHARDWKAEFLFDTRHFLREDVACLAGQYVTLLTEALAQSGKPVSELDINSTSHSEKLQLWRNTEQLNTDEALLHNLFEQQVRYYPERIAVRDEHEILTYLELDQRANQIAHLLKEKGIGPDSVVGICVERSAAMLVAILGILKAGGAYLPLESSYPQERLDYMLNDSSAPVIITQTKLRDRFATCTRDLVLIDRWEEICGYSPTPAVSEVAARNLAYVIYTSGSTGRPKGVMVEHYGAVNYVRWAIKSYGAWEEAGAPVHSPLAFDLTVTGLWVILAAGKTVHMIPENEGIEGLSKVLSGETMYSLVKLTPSHLESLRELADAHQTCTTRCFVVGGEALKQQTASWWLKHVPGLRIVNEYGPTETVVGCCTYDVQVENEANEVPIGREIANLRMYVLNENLEEAGLWEAGEIYIAGHGVARGYLGRPDLTAERFLPEPGAEFQGRRMYRTGDLGRRRLDGNLEYIGRCDEQIKIRGYRVELGEIEAVLVAEPGIKNAAVVTSGEGSEMRLVCYLVAENDAHLETDDLRSTLSKKLPGYMVPDQYIAIDAMPLSPNGKVQKRDLPEPGRYRHKSHPGYVAPASKVEQILAEIWCEVLGASRVGRSDNYFAMGGDSMRSVRVVALARKQNIHISLQDLFQYQTLWELAAKAKVTVTEMAQAQDTRPFCLISEADKQKLPQGLEDAYPLSMLQAGMLYHLDLESESAMYHNISSFHIKAFFAAVPFQKAVNQIIARHAIFRTSFDLTSFSEPLQLVHQLAELQVEARDLRGLAFDEQQQVIQQYVELQKRHPLDLTRGPLLRLCIHQRSDETFNLTVTVCHAIVDGWSVSSTIAEIFDRYFAIVENTPSIPEPPLRSTFRDFVQLERQAISSPECQQFWEGQLEGCIPTPLPRWKTEPNSASEDNSSFVRVPLPVDLLGPLTELATQFEVSLKAIFMAAHVKLLSILTGQTDVLTGLSCHGRPELLDGDRVRGNFLNTIPYRMQVGNGTWKELIKSVFVKESETVPYQRYPFALLQKWWGKETFVDTLFACLHFHSLQEISNSGRMEFLSDGNLDVGETSFALTSIFWISPFPKTMPSSLFLQFAREMPPMQVKTIGKWYLAVLRAIAINPESRHSDLSLFHMLEDDERGLLEQDTDLGEMKETFTF